MFSKEIGYKNPYTAIKSRLNQFAVTLYLITSQPGINHAIPFSKKKTAVRIPGFLNLPVTEKTNYIYHN
jgi:hypothetical protein